MKKICKNCKNGKGINHKTAYIKKQFNYCEKIEDIVTSDTAECCCEFQFCKKN